MGGFREGEGPARVQRKKTLTRPEKGKDTHKKVTHLSVRDLAGLRGEGPTRVQQKETLRPEKLSAEGRPPRPPRGYPLTPHGQRRAQGGSARNPGATPHPIPSHHTPALSLTRKFS